MERQIPPARRREVERILAHEQRYLRAGLPPDVKITTIAPGVSGGEPETNQRSGRRSSKARRELGANSKSTVQNLDKARELKAEGKTPHTIARLIGVAPGTVRDWIAKLWI